VLLAQIIAFVVLLVLLWKFLFRPVSDMMMEREERIANNLAAADAQRQQADTLRQEYETHLAQIADEARAKLEQAVKDGEAARQRQLDAAQAEIRELYTRNQAQLELEREQLRRDLRGELGNLAVLAAEKALRQNMTPTLQAAVVDQVIRDLDTAAPNA
jgi:F-type H+-transporting ATPase subunit b